MKFLTPYLNNIKRNRAGLLLIQAILLVGLSTYLISCDRGANEFEGKEEIARYGEIPLFREELDYFLPQWQNEADSVRLAQRFIEDWMQAQAIAERARTVMGDLDDEVVYKRNDFERRMIEFKFAQYLIANQLNTLVSDAEIRNYYKKQPDKFISQTNYFSHFFLKTENKNSNRELGWMRANDRKTIDQLEAWAKENASEFKLDSAFVTLTTIKSVLEGSRLNPAYLRKNNVYTFNQKEDDKTYFIMFKLNEEVKEGELMPLSMCRETIKDILLNQRKNRLVETTEKDLLKNARKSGKVNIVGEADSEQ